MTKRERWKVVAAAGHTGASLALAIGVSKQTTCRHLNGTQFNADTAELIAQEVGRDAVEMWPRQRKAAA